MSRILIRGGNILKRISLVALLLTFVTAFCGLTRVANLQAAFATEDNGQASNVSASEAQEKMGSVQIPFIENKGQIADPVVKYYANTFTGTAFVGADGITYAFSGPEDSQSPVIKEQFKGTRPAAPIGLKKAVTKVNYYKGEQKDWQTGLPAYEEIGLGEVYDGIKVSLRAYGKNVEKIFTVVPGNDPAEIAVDISGADKLLVNDQGELVITAGGQTVTMTHPVAYQDIDGRRVDVAVAYQLNGQEYGFKVGSYNTNYPLVIDPLLASRLLGGSKGSIVTGGDASGGDDDAFAVTTDTGGNVYLTGRTRSSDFPVSVVGTVYGFTSLANTSCYDVVVAKLSSNLEQLQAIAFLGGNNTNAGKNWGTGIALDSSRNVYITGFTRDPNFPHTIGTFGGGSKSDAFVCKFNNDLDSIIGSTFLGTPGEDVARAIAIDPWGNVIIAGRTNNNAFPVCAENGAQPYNNGTFYGLSGTNFMGFVSKFSSNLTQLLASTLIGGSKNEDIFGMTLDSAGNVYITGYTTSDGSGGGTKFPGTSIQTGSQDIFVSKLNNQLTQLIASTSLGATGSASDNGGRAIALDSNGNIFVTGRIDISVAITQDAYHYINFGSAGVAKLGPDMNLKAFTRIDSTYGGYALKTDADGNVYVFGMIAGGTPLCTTEGSLYPSYPGGSYSTFVTKLNNDLSKLLNSTYLGGSSMDFCGFGGSNGIATNTDPYPFGMAIDAFGNVVVVGSTFSTDFPRTLTGNVNAKADTGADMFISKLDMSYPTWSNGGSLTAIYVTGTGLTLNWSGANDNIGVTKYSIYQGDTRMTTVTGSVYTVTGVTPGDSYTFRILAGDDGGNWSPTGPSLTLLLKPVTGVSLNKTTDTITAGGTAQLTATVAPADATNQGVSWSSRDTTVATVSDTGLVTAVKAGTARITVTTADGSFIDYCDVTVQAATVAVTGVSLNKTTDAIIVGGTDQLTVTIAPADATNKNVTWSSSDDTVATVSGTGLVTAIKAGTARITVTTADGGFTDTCNVTVDPGIITISGVPASLALTIGSGTQTVSASVYPTDASLSYISSDTNKVTVNSNGVITAVAPGSANITVTATKTGYNTATTTVAVTVTASTQVTQLTKPAKPKLVDKIASWTAVANENNGYSLQLYKDKTEAGAPVIIPNGAALSYDLSAAMTIPGSYTVAVTARGTGAYADSPASDQSDPQYIVGNGGQSGQAQLPSGVTSIQLGDNSKLELEDVQTAADGKITVGGQALDLSSFKSGSLENNVNLTVSQNVGGQSILVETAVLLKSGNEGESVTITNPNVPNVSATIPDGTTILAPAGWNGSIDPPKVGQSAGTAPSGFTVGNTIIEVGSPDAVLLFDKPVTLTLQGVTGPVGYKPAGSSAWVQISSLAGGTYDSPVAPAFPGEAYITNGTDTKIITWHFTSFASLVANQQAGGGGGGGGSNTPKAVTSTTGTATVTPSAGGTISLGSEAAIEVPADALTGTGTVEVRVQKVTTPPAVPTGFKLAGSVYEFSVGGKNSYSFAKNVTIKLSFDSSAVSAGETPSIQYYDETKGQWVNLGGTVSGNTITAQVSHFTKFAVMATMKEEQKKEEEKAATLSDITGHWAEANINRLVALGAVSGYPGGTFKPDATITRAEFATILVKAFKLENKEGKIFNDTASHWAKDNIAAAAANGIVSGYDTDTFGPDDLITREQMAAMIANAAKLATESSQGTSFIDSADISPWATGAVAVAVRNGVIKGYPDNTFLPQGNATRAEAVTVIVNALRP